MHEPNATTDFPETGETDDLAGLGSQRYLELFKRLTPLIGNQDEEDICVRACALIAEMLEVEDCSLLLADAGRTCLTVAAATHIPKSEWSGIRLPLNSDGICAHVFKSGNPLLIQGEESFRKQFGRASNERYETSTCAVLPLFMADGVSGVINVAHPIGRRSLLPSDVELLETIANLIATALAAAMQHRERQKFYKNLEEIFNSLHVGVLAVDHEGRVTQMNRRMGVLLNRDEESARQAGLSQVLPGILYQIAKRLMEQSTQMDEPAQDRVEIQIGSRRRMLEMTVGPMRCLGGALSYALIMLEDVGQDEEVKRLRESEAMKRNFLSIISHELRTPLAVIRGALPLIDPSVGQPIEPNTLRQVYRLMLKNCQRLGDVVSAILDVTEIESGTLCLSQQILDIHELLDEVISIHTAGAMSKQIVWECHFQSENSQVLGDRRRLFQVFSEMVSNAIKFSNAGGRIQIQTRRMDCQGQPMIAIEIGNRGTLIEPALRKTIFNKFCQGNPTMTRMAGGCGLGLYLVQNLICMHGGGVELLECEGDETLFRLQLPLIAVQSQAGPGEDIHREVK